MSESLCFTYTSSILIKNEFKIILNISYGHGLLQIWKLYQIFTTEKLSFSTKFKLLTKLKITIYLFMCDAYSFLVKITVKYDKLRFQRIEILCNHNCVKCAIVVSHAYGHRQSRWPFLKGRLISSCC